MPSLSAPETIDQLLAAIRGTAPARIFFRKLWRSPDMQRLFFAHRGLLFPFIDEDGIQVSLPFLFFDTLPNDDDEREQVEQLVHTPLELNAEKRNALMDRIRPGTEGLAREAQAIAVLLVVRFVRSNPALVQVIQQPESPLYADLSRMVSNHPPTAAGVFDDFSDIERLWNDGVTVGADPALIGLFKRAVEYVRRSMRVGAIEVGDGSVEMTDVVTEWLGTPSKFIPAYLLGHYHLNLLLGAQGLGRTQYQKLLEVLYLQRAVANMFTAFICGQCYDDPLVLTTTSRLSPAQQKLPCPKCGQQTFAVGMYRVDPVLKRAIFSKDGILAVAAVWLLTEKGASVKTGAFVGDHEMDCQFEIADKPFLLEVKMHKTGKDDEAVGANLVKAARQACKTGDKIVTSGGKLDHVVVLTNYDRKRYASEIKRACSRHKRSASSYKLTITDPTGFERLVRDAKEDTR